MAAIKDLIKISDWCWEIPKNFKPGMRVPGRIYASEDFLEHIVKDKCSEQVANVAFLPGIVKYSLAMPDVHWGYGFCLTEDARILTDFGYYRHIIDFENDWKGRNIRSIDMKSQRPVVTPIERFIKLRARNIFRLVTKTGHVIKATGDHPFLTSSGMKPLEKLPAGEKVAVFPFQGVEYEEPSHDVIITESDIRKTLQKMGRNPGTNKHDIILKKLAGRGLLSITYSHPALPYLLKIMAFIFGDGTMNFIGARGDGVLHFAGKPRDLEEARKDLRQIGYTPGPVYHQRQKASKDSNKLFDCYSFSVNASSLVVLLETLGVPRGTKVSQAYRIPAWIFNAPLWQKRLFLAALFGCELRKPHRRLERKGYFNAPVFPMAKREELITNAEDFLGDITTLLKEFGVEVLYVDKRNRHVSKKGKVSWLLELLISPKPENLLNLWSRIGFEYNAERSFLANTAAQYLRLKLRMLKEKDEAVRITIPQLLKEGLSYRKVALQLAGNPLTKRFVIDVCWKLRRGRNITPRIPAHFPAISDYTAKVTEGLGRSGMVWDEIVKIERMPEQDFVYDFTVAHSDHNFIANNFVVSNCIGGVAATDVEAGGVISPGGIGFDTNCGVRLLRTSLTKEEAAPQIRELIKTLFRDVPCGVGVGGNIRVGAQELKQLLKKGSRWAIEKGFGVKEDLECTENNGCMEDADPDAVSERAIKRGLDQSGTLGSGNHFLEVQEVEKIFDRESADAFGLFEGQVTVMIHSGSRGFGYQVCDDYLRVMRGCPEKYGFSIPDRQLVAAPVNSEEGQRYLSAMFAAANYAWANRQCLMHLTRMAFEKVFKRGQKALGLDLVYDVAHNIAKIERHVVGGKEKLLCVHRKGATRAFPRNHPEIPEKYRGVGQPVIIPGDMGRNSYVMVGTERAMEETFGSICHGAGRLMSRTEAVRRGRGTDLIKELEKKGIIVMATGRGTVSEEAPYAYKDVNEVISVVANAGLAKPVAKMRPLGVIKG